MDGPACLDGLEQVIAARVLGAVDPEPEEVFLRILVILPEAVDLDRGAADVVHADAAARPLVPAAAVGAKAADVQAVRLQVFVAVSREGPVVTDGGGHPGTSGEAATGQVESPPNLPGEDAAQDVGLVVPVEEAFHP